MTDKANQNTKTVPRVFVTQETSAVDYTPATKFGDLVFITGNSDRLSPHPLSLNNTAVKDKIQRSLEDFTENDYLVCTGAPVHMAMAASILGDRLKKILAWDNRSMMYFVVNN